MTSDRATPLPAASRPDSRANRPSKSRSERWFAVLTDTHFWVPTMVLLMGLAVLRWIS